MKSIGCLSLFERLQGRQSSWIFDGSFVPPCASDVIWSRSNFCPRSVRQHAHLPFCAAYIRVTSRRVKTAPLVGSGSRRLCERAKNFSGSRAYALRLCSRSFSGFAFFHARDNSRAVSGCAAHHAFAWTLVLPGLAAFRLRSFSRAFSGLSLAHWADFTISRS